MEMQNVKFSRWTASTVFFAATLMGFAATVALTAAPAFSTQAAISGKIGSTFLIVAPLVNAGEGAADDVQVTGITLGNAALRSPALPLLLGSFSPHDLSGLHLPLD